MKTLITPVAALTLLTASSATAQAEGSQFEKSTSINATENSLRNTQTIGSITSANNGSVNIK